MPRGCFLIQHIPWPPRVYQWWPVVITQNGAAFTIMEYNCIPVEASTKYNALILCRSFVIMISLSTCTSGKCSWLRTNRDWPSSTNRRQISFLNFDSKMHEIASCRLFAQYFICMKFEHRLSLACIVLSKILCYRPLSYKWLNCITSRIIQGQCNVTCKRTPLAMYRCCDLCVSKLATYSERGVYVTETSQAPGVAHAGVCISNLVMRMRVISLTISRNKRTELTWRRWSLAPIILS